ncbi:epidermal growth factor receptor isoform X1 [Drosophila guanche]|uniref:Receptor protein-tyrosine kinase n=1 Tax=Drosophila guanche TaxID=7266 RepID=A0A3B0J202_DROGU|nr:epidermal growth factor receptor isoform X1 [Drosophila guanche]SPP75364.1 blast:Epidermal growth factor receptor [Drosophila guanche]
MRTSFKLLRRRNGLCLPLLLLLLAHCVCVWPASAARDRYARQNNRQRNQDVDRDRDRYVYRSSSNRQRNSNRGGGHSNNALGMSLGAGGVTLANSMEDQKSNEFVKGKICIGTKSRLSSPSNREHHYRNLRDRYTNCTYVDGNLELTWLQDPNLDLSFLDSIREVTGYILISHVDVTKVVFPKLQIIRGRTLFSLAVEDEKYALFAIYSKMYTLEMPELRDILQGGVGFFNNFNLCHTRTIVWREILTGSTENFNYTYNFTAPERECPKCHEKCGSGPCWGEGAHNCQKFSKINCAPQCAQGRCYGRGPRECCHLFCAGGCTGPTQKDCIACKNFFDEGVCKEECPPMRKYNPTSYILETNPEGKYAYGATCVKECPGHLLKDNGACVRSCPSDKMAKEGDCVPCNGPCPKTCPGVETVNSGNIESLRNCTVIDGNIRILDQTFYGYQDVYVNYTMGPRYIPLDPERLEVFSTVKEITGYLNIEGNFSGFRNLSYFRNLEIIHGRQLMESLFAALSIVKSSLHSLEMRNLKRISSGSVVIQHNRNLCYVGDIRWNAVQKSPDQKQWINENLNAAECRKAGLVCSDQCNEDGCWGSGTDQCLNCKNFNYNGTCIADCRNITNAYQFDTKTCKMCHPECRTCSGPGADHCDECVHVRDEQHCVSECPEEKYSENGVCLRCHETCEGCTGPKDTIGAGGCKTCNLAIINNDATVERCLLKDDKCPDGYYWEYVHPQEQGTLKPLAGKAVCRKCHPRCELCTNYGFHEQVCSKCVGYKRREQCEDECPADHYTDEEQRECFECHPECKGCTGPGSDDCIACRNFKLFGFHDAATYENSTLFNCTSKCPTEFRHVNYQSLQIGPYCASSPPRGGKLNASLDVNMIAIITIAVLIATICILSVVTYLCRQKQKAKKETVKMTMALSGCEDSEPLRPSNIGANLCKLRIVKDAELRKGGVLGMGAFGRVFKGVWVPEGENVKIPVAIKELLKSSGAESSEEFLREAYIMASVEHGNLLKLLAVCMSSQMMLITQLMPLGCLLDYVRNNRDKIGSKALLNWSTQIAKGMSYLEEKRLVHRDLAARNVLVQTPSLVKITDFGLAKLLSSDSNEYKAAGGKMPIKWLALECIRNRVFTSKSDVWAFGVTIWELLTFGQRPHENIPAKDIPDLIEVGLKLEQPEICSLDIYCTLLSCWHLDAAMRPTFKQLMTVFAEFARDPGRYLAIPGDKFTRLPAYTSQDEKDLIRKLAPTSDGSEPMVEADDYLQPKAAPGPSHRTDGTDEIPKLNRYCKDPSNKNSNGGVVGDDETDSSAREVGVGNLRLDLPVDEDDYLMPTCQGAGPNNNNNHINPNHNVTGAGTTAGYMDLIGVPVSVDNPEYLLNAQALNVGEAPIPTQTIGIPVMGVPGTLEVKIPIPGSEPTSSDHEYYNDTQRELQPLHRNRNTETRV